MRFFLLALFLLGFCAHSAAQELQIDSLGFETFEMTEGDTSYVMKKYFMAILKTGPNRDHSAEQATEIQKGHMENISLLAEQKKICIAGPFGDQGEMRGILIFNVPTMEEVKALVAQDPAVIAGRLILDVHPWWAAKGSILE